MCNLSFVGIDVVFNLNLIGSSVVAEFQLG